MNKSAHHRLWTLLGLLVILVFGAGAAFAQGVNVTISTEREAYKAGQPIRVTYTVDNQTGKTIEIEGSSCTAVFGLYAFDIDSQLLWNSGECISCCCTCCECPIQLFTRNIR